MGGDLLVPMVCGNDIEQRLGDAIRDAESEEYMRLIDQVAPVDGARDLIADLKRRGHRVVLARQLGERGRDRTSTPPPTPAWKRSP